ncbi:reverse transcriptase domain-containing protein [Chryseobacterium taklimakanense]|uniref:reverse transcriptase domain-containing protein n=1 Tax=Chryseobacterium taklimakanense TaxID=536441 RepID=UPI0023F69B57|nr:reverse transcriptase domain-containing protein [Chryseobacterium taklimakanense]
MQKKDWFKVKRYPHIDFPLEGKMRSKWIEGYVTSEEKVAKHSFLPFIHKTIYQRKFRKEYDDKNGKIIYHQNEKGELVERYADKKKREIYYASHLDSLIYSYYAQKLNSHYEDKINQFGLNDVVSAYRAVKINPQNSNSANKCNIDFANDVFQFILQYPETEFSVIAFDISSFFDNLDHKILRDIWMEIMGVSELPKDHFNVFKNITRFSHVNIIDIFTEFQDRIFTRAKSKNGNYLPIKRKKVAKLKFLKSQNAIAFCTKKEFFNIKNKLLQPSRTVKDKNGNIKYKNFGIPQGSPISSVLANMYLMHFDATIKSETEVVGGIYRRYSDDMVVICPLESKDKMIDVVLAEIKKYKLEIQSKKTQIFRFKKLNGRLICGQEFDDEINWNKNFVYLGFEFDGVYTRIKSGSVANYYRKMKRSIKRAKHFGAKKGKFQGEIFRRRLYKRFTFKGIKRYKKYKWNDEQKKFIKSEDYNWGNFLSYADKAAGTMVNNKIKSQVKNHWKIFHQELKR